MHPFFETSDILPVAPGSSPFHFKGFYYDRMFARLKGTPGLVPRLLAELKDDRVREFAQQRFTWNGWYDALPSMPLYTALARMQGTDVTSYVRSVTRVSSQSLVPSMFRLTTDLSGGPGVVAAMITKFVMHTVDFASANLESVDSTHAVARGSGIPLYIAPSITGLVLGWFEGVLRSAGAEDVTAAFDDVKLQSRPDAFDRVSVRFDFRWRVDEKRMSASRSSSRLANAIANRLTRAK